MSRWTRLSCATAWTWQITSSACICNDTYIKLPGFSIAGRPNAALQNLAAPRRSEVWQSMITVLKRLWCMRLLRARSGRPHGMLLRVGTSHASWSQCMLAERGNQKVTSPTEPELRLGLGEVE